MSNETCRHGPKVFLGQAILKKMIGGQRRLSKSIQGYWGQAMFKQKMLAKETRRTGPGVIAGKPFLEYNEWWPKKPVETDPGKFAAKHIQK